MFRGVRWLALAAVVAAAALVGPSAAFACDGSGSAVSIYTQCVPSAKGHTKPPATHPVTTPQQTTTYYTPTTPVQVAPPKPHHHTQTPPKPVVVKVHHQTKAVQTVLVAASVSSLDLGTGPTIFFALLLGTVLVLLGVGGARSWRNRHRV